MNVAHWQALMTRWNSELLDSEYGEYVEPEIIASGWLGHPGATEEQLQQAEARLGKRLPPSYREFLKFSNGWEMATPFINKLWSTEEIEWLAVLYQKDLIDPWLYGAGPEVLIPDEEYLVYGEEQIELFPAKYLQGALAISDYEDGIFLLNPQVVTEEGEWEAWFFAEWIPGAHRYRSFWEMMQAEHESFLMLKAQDEKRLLPSDDLAVLPTKLSGLIEGFDEKIESWRTAQQNPMSLDYPEGVIEGLEFAKGRIQEIQKQSQDHRVLYDRLLGLADELDTRDQQAQSAMQQISMSAIFTFNLSEMMEQIRASGTAIGYQQAATQIRWFLNEESFQ